MGIIPLATYSFEPFTSLGRYDIRSIEEAGWELPGHGDPYDDCGRTLVFGCLDVDAHNQARLDGVDVLGKIYVDLKKRTCLRPACPICYEKWAGRGAKRIENRIKQYTGSGKPIHLVVSPHRSMYHLSVIELRKKAQAVAKKVGFFGGSCIVHPFREHCVLCHEAKDTQTKRCPKCGCSEFSWYYSPHYHMIGYGWIHGHKVAELNKKEGWVTKNLGVRLSVFITAMYQLSHAGIHEHHDTVSWFGTMARNKMRTIPEVHEKKKCPLCGGDLIKLHWMGKGECPIPDVEGDYFVSPDGWIPGFSSRDGG